MDVSADGEVVVGSGGGQAFYWRWKVDPAPTFIGGEEAVAVSDDGTVIAGTMNDPATGKNTAARWTASTGWVLLGDLGTTCDANNMSGDGSTIVGLGWNNCSGQAFVWTEANSMGSRPCSSSRRSSPTGTR